MTPKQEIILGCAIAVAAIAAIGFAANYHSYGIGPKIANITLQAMERGYQCRIDGRGIEDCKSEQREIWRRVEAGEPYQPFGKN